MTGLSHMKYRFGVIAILTLALLISGFAAADPLPAGPRQPEYKLPWLGQEFVVLVGMNIVPNIALLAISMLLVFAVFRNNVAYDTKIGKFAICFFAVAFIGTLFGALVDIFLVGNPLYDFWAVKHYPEYHPNLALDWLMLLAALALIGFSFFVLSKYFLKLTVKQSAFVGSAMALFNVVVWGFVGISVLEDGPWSDAIGGAGVLIRTFLYCTPIALVPFLFLGYHKTRKKILEKENKKTA